MFRVRSTGVFAWIPVAGLVFVLMTPAASGVAPPAKGPTTAPSISVETARAAFIRSSFRLWPNLQTPLPRGELHADSVFIKSKSNQIPNDPPGQLIVYANSYWATRVMRHPPSKIYFFGRVYRVVNVLLVIDRAGHATSEQQKKMLSALTTLGKPKRVQ